MLSSLPCPLTPVLCPLTPVPCPLPPTALAASIAVNYPPRPAGVLRLPLVQRLALVTAGTVLIGLLATAACLTPSPRGMGTHQQLGLPPCTVVQWFGVRCPSCGMT